MPRLKKVGKRFGIGCLGLLVVFALFLGLTGPGRDILNLWKNGLIQSLLAGSKKRTYNANNEQNLAALRTAMMLYHESEGQFPDSKGWMEAVQNRIKAEDMETKEAQKKLIRPDLLGQPGEYGYSMNDAASQKYKDDIPKSTILLYESKQTVRNAHGDAKTDRDGYAITVDGKVLKPGE